MGLAVAETPPTSAAYAGVQVITLAVTSNSFLAID